MFMMLSSSPANGSSKLNGISVKNWFPVTAQLSAGVAVDPEIFHLCTAPCGLRGGKNESDPFPGRLSYKATKPVCQHDFIVLLFIRAPFYVLLVFIVCVLSFGCSS